MNNEYILLFPFCSKKHQNKKWPYFKQLIVKLKEHYKNKYPILIAPGPNEIKEAIFFHYVTSLILFLLTLKLKRL